MSRAVGLELLLGSKGSIDGSVEMVVDFDEFGVHGEWVAVVCECTFRVQLSS